jgi:hypothetical protein
MKKLLFILLFIPLISLGQTYSNPYPKPIKIEVSKAPKTSADHLSDMQKNISNSFSKAAANYSANASARASNLSANSEAMKVNYSRINTDILINNDETYDAIVLDKVSGWAVDENKKTITKILGAKRKYYFYSQRKEVPKFLKGSDKILYLSWSREAVDDYTRITNIQVRDSKRQVVYDVTHKNKSYLEMLEPFTSQYKLNKEMALQKLKELKGLKELEVISKEEYDAYVQKYKSIILKGF